MIRPLKPEALRRIFDPKALGLKGTEGTTPAQDIIGQERAVSAIQFGLAVREEGFNVYVAGPPGVGKMTVVRTFLEEMAAAQGTPPDWCYVNDFEDSYQPKSLSLPAGKGRALQKDMRSLVLHARQTIPRIFDNDEYNRRREEILKTFNRQKGKVQERIAEKAKTYGFELQPMPMGVALVPMHEGKRLGDAELAQLPVSQREALFKKREALQAIVQKAFKEMRDIDRALQAQLQDFDGRVVLHVVGGLFDDLLEKYKDLPAVLEYLQAVRKDILENIELFKGEGESSSGDSDPMAAPWAKELPFRRYEVNVLVDNSAGKGAPLIVERNPTFGNLVGRVEKETHMGTLHTDATLIKGGALHQANGGYLVLPIEDVLKNTMSWDALKRALRTGAVEIEDLSDRMGFVSTKSLRPAPIPLDVKVVLVGQSSIYALLMTYDEEFTELFKVKADFDVWMDATDSNVRQFAAYLCTLCRRDKMLHLEPSAVGKLLEHAARLAEDQGKLSIYFGSLADVVREANHWAVREKASRISADHVRRAVEEQVYRANLGETHLREMTARGTLLLDVHGMVVGQVNGLAVLSMGDHSFGRPSRITATVGPGREGVLDIDREVEMSGPIHSKGVLILEGCLSQRFGQERPVSLSSRLVFEQSYDGIDGDSASSTELYALLSALSGMPIRQGIAVTGSVNQFGQVQAIGGVNEKVEGFFDICKILGLDGRQGVMIPASNVRNLMLREDVVDAVRAGKFNLWPVSTIEEGIEVLTGKPAGKRGKDGRFPKGCVFAEVETRLRGYAEALKDAPESAAAERSAHACKPGCPRRSGGRKK
ncbi:MAG: ATP-binding protein [Elusimicrobiota bacterium]|jgi:lon-related putative ATP-dependent protease